MTDLEKLYEHCGIDDPMQQIIQNVRYTTYNGKKYITVDVYHKRLDYTDEFDFGEHSSLWNFLVNHYKLS